VAPLSGTDIGTRFNSGHLWGKPLSIDAISRVGPFPTGLHFWHTNCVIAEMEGALEAHPHSASEKVRGELETATSTNVCVAPILRPMDFSWSIPKRIAENRRGVTVAFH
jgi:hypothetical protein